MSAFKEGTVVDINQTTNELTIKLDQPHSTVFSQPSKFYAPPDDLIEEGEEDTTTVNFISLLSFIM
jgi:hypothetical protein